MVNRFLEILNVPPHYPVIMGIVNVTPDSFFSESRCASKDLLINKVQSHLTEGADIIDIGACSTRPGSAAVSEEEELRRLLPALEVIRKEFPEVPLSVDTFRGKVAARAIKDFKVAVINDVYAFDRDESMLDALAELRAPYVLMHYGEVTESADVVGEVRRFFKEKIEILKSKGVNDIIIDPGYGFGKTMKQNFHLLAHQSELNDLGCPILAGLSRKRMVWQTLHCTPEEALNGTTVLNTIALRQGASILRVHDVQPAVEAIRLCHLCE